MVVKHRKYLIKFVNELCGEQYEDLSDIPEERFMLVKDFDYLTIVLPFVLKDMRDGLSINQLKIKYSIGYATIRTIGQKAGMYTCWKPTREKEKAFNN